MFGAVYRIMAVQNMKLNMNRNAQLICYLFFQIYCFLILSGLCERIGILGFFDKRIHFNFLVSRRLAKFSSRFPFMDLKNYLEAQAWINE